MRAIELTGVGLMAPNEPYRSTEGDVGSVGTPGSRADVVAKNLRSASVQPR